MNKVKLVKVAKQLVAPGKGILAADESSGTIEKRLNSIGLPSTEKNRINWRGLLFSTPHMNRFISGVILFDETIRQKWGKVTFAKYLRSKGVLPGIKVDKGAHQQAFFEGEKVTDGLDGLRERCEEYVKLGAGFTKWRAVITMGKGLPTQGNIEVNAHALARYAALSQEAGLVPIVEPEVLMTGTHTIAEHEEATTRTLKEVFAQLKRQKVYLQGMLLKPNMVASGLEAKSKASPAEVAKVTVRTFRKTVPSAVPGCVFLSGGLSPEEATVNLNTINKVGKQPWELSYSFGRALQGEALDLWKGKEGMVREAQKAFYKRAESVAMGRMGKLDTR